MTKKPHTGRAAVEPGANARISTKMSAFIGPASNPIYFNLRSGTPSANGNGILASVFGRQATWTELNHCPFGRVADKLDVDAWPAPLVGQNLVATFTLCRSISAMYQRHSSFAFGMAAKQPLGGIGDVEPSVGRVIISGTAIRSLAEDFNRTSAVPFHELAGHVFNKMVVVHDRQNSG